MTKTEIQRILQKIFNHYRFVREWDGTAPEPDTFIAQLPAWTPPAFLNKLYLDYAAQKGAQRWGDKTPIYSSYLPLLDKIFPGAQFIHLYRDGRDVAVSMLEKWGERDFHIDIYFAARNWDRRTRQVRTAGAAVESGRFHEIRYEELVAEPEHQLQVLCNFLGETYIPEMAAPHRLAQSEIEPGSFHDPVRNPPSTTRSGRWQTDLAARDVRLFQRVAGSLLETLGYEVQPVHPMASHESLRYAALKSKYGILQSGRRVPPGLRGLSSHLKAPA